VLKSAESRLIDGIDVPNLTDCLYKFEIEIEVEIRVEIELWSFEF
jgi:hypothetical protein